MLIVQHIIQHQLNFFLYRYAAIYNNARMIHLPTGEKAVIKLHELLYLIWFLSDFAERNVNSNA